MFSAFARGGFSKPKKNPEADDNRSSDTASYTDYKNVQTTSNTAAPETTTSASSASHNDASTAYPCPPNSLEIGRATWTFLHTTAAYYPNPPSSSQQSVMRSMMEGLAEFYPCHYCAAHLREQLKDSPPQVGSATELSQWLCKIHNEVRTRLCLLRRTG
jgi:hypothetical protein